MSKVKPGKECEYPILNKEYPMNKERQDKMEQTPQRQDRLQEIEISVKALKKLVFGLLIALLALSAAFSLYVAQENKRLREQLATAAFESNKLRYERNLMDSMIREVEAYALTNPELDGILKKYRVGRGEREQNDSGT